MSPESTLLRAQRAFLAAIYDAAEEGAAVPLLAGSAERNRALLQLYRGNAVANATKALTLVYPVLRQIVGDEFFGALVRVYWRAEPPASGNLNEYGAGFAGFLAGFAPAAELAYLPDVARLEWQVHQAYGAADHSPLGGESLAGLAQVDLAARHLRVQPALALLASPWPVASIWRQHQPGHPGALSIDLATPECALVFRMDLQVRVEAIDAAEFAFWRACVDGLALAEAMTLTFDASAGFNPLRVMQRSFERGLIVALE